MDDAVVLQPELGQRGRVSSQHLAVENELDHFAGRQIVSKVQPADEEVVIARLIQTCYKRVITF